MIFFAQKNIYPKKIAEFIIGSFEIRKNCVNAFLVHSTISDYVHNSLLYVESIY